MLSQKIVLDLAPDTLSKDTPVTFRFLRPITIPLDTAVNFIWLNFGEDPQPEEHMINIFSNAIEIGLSYHR